MDSLKGTLTPMKVLNGTLNGGIAYGTFNYNELENKPSVNGTELVGNVNIAIPTKTSDLTNDSGFITDADVPTKTSDLTNDSGFITDADIPTKTSELTNDSGFITSADIPTIPSNTSQLNNDSGFLTINTTPVKSVNSLTGDVNLFIPNATSQLNNDSGFLTNNTVPVKSVNNQTGNIKLTADNIPYDSENSTAEKIDENTQAINEKANASDVYTKSETDAAIDNNLKRVFISWGTSATLPVDRGHFIVLINDKIYQIWFAGGLTLYVTNICTNTVTAAEHSATLDNITFTRNARRLTVTASENKTITIIG